MSMGPRNLLILFFSTVAVSLVILIIFFSLFFKNVDLNFNTRLPESAPDIGRQYTTVGSNMNPESKADGLMRSTVNVPPEFKEPESTGGHQAGDGERKEDAEAAEQALPPVSDDILLDQDAPISAPRKVAPPRPERAATPEKPSAAPSRNEQRPTPPPPSPAPSMPAPRVQHRAEPTPSVPVNMPEPIEEPASSGPPVPGQ